MVDGVGKQQHYKKRRKHSKRQGELLSSPLHQEIFPLTISQTHTLFASCRAYQDAIDLKPGLNAASVLFVLNVMFRYAAGANYLSRTFVGPKNSNNVDNTPEYCLVLLQSRVAFWTMKHLSFLFTNSLRR